MPPQSVLDRALEVGADLWRVGQDFNVSGDKQQWGWAGRGRRYSGLAYPALRGANQLVNAAGVLAALDGVARAPAGHGAGGAQRPGVCRVAGALSDHAGPADAGAGRGAQPACGGGAGGQSGRHGLLSRPPTRCLAPWPTRTWRPCWPR